MTQDQPRASEPFGPTISIRNFSHAVPTAISRIEAEKRPVFITKRGTIIAGLVPVNLGDLFARWAGTNRVVEKSDTVTMADARLGLLDADYVGPASGNLEPAGSVSVRELSRNTSRILGKVQNGRSVVITRHNTVVAALFPATFAEVFEARLSQWSEAVDILAFRHLKSPIAITEALENGGLGF